MIHAPNRPRAAALTLACALGALTAGCGAKTPDVSRLDPPVSGTGSEISWRLAALRAVLESSTEIMSRMQAEGGTPNEADRQAAWSNTLEEMKLRRELWLIWDTHPDWQVRMCTWYEASVLEAHTAYIKLARTQGRAFTRALLDAGREDPGYDAYRKEWATLSSFPIADCQAYGRMTDW